MKIPLFTHESGDMQLTTSNNRPSEPIGKKLPPRIAIINMGVLTIFFIDIKSLLHNPIKVPKDDDINPKPIKSIYTSKNLSL